MARSFTPVHVAALRELDHVVQKTRPADPETPALADTVRGLANRVATELHGESAHFTAEDAALVNALAWEWIDDAPQQGMHVPLPERIAFGQALLDVRDVIADRLG
jgi:hypothetical protein